MKPPAIVADTNVIVSALLWEGNESKIIGLAEEGRIKLLTSVALLRELKNVLSHERFGLEEETIDENVKYILIISEIVSPKQKLKVIQEDPADDRVLECALEGRAEYIVSGNKHLLRLKKFRETKIVHAKELLGLLG